MKPAHLTLLTIAILAASLSHAADETVSGSFIWTVGTLQSQVTVSTAATQSIPVLVNGVGSSYTVTIPSAPGTVFFQGQPVAIMMIGSLPFSNSVANGTVMASLGDQSFSGLSIALDANKKTKTNVAYIGSYQAELASNAFALGGFSFNNGLTLQFIGSSARFLPTAYTLTLGLASKNIAGTATFSAFGSHTVGGLFAGKNTKGIAAGTGSVKPVAYDGTFTTPTGVAPSTNLPFAQLYFGAYSAAAGLAGS
jgi:hypothetical protein